MRHLVAAVLLLVTLPALLGAAQAPVVDCAPWQECRDRALDARERGQFERFHDLAWRAIQTGPANDPALMYLLARAQASSGRRRDALIMLRRLADMGAVTDAATEDDFRRTRELTGWAEIERTFERLRSGGGVLANASPAAPPPLPAPLPAPSAPVPAPSAPAPVPAPASPIVAPPAVRAPNPLAVRPSAPPSLAAPPPPAVAPARPAAAPAPPKAVLTIAPVPATELTRFSTARFLPAGLAYDGVSRRFLFGDTLGRRLFVVGEGSDRPVDLVRAERADFHGVTGLAIDPRRGDLWVTSTSADGATGAIHRLQLVSGRALATFEASGSALAVSDVAVAANGTVLVLDGGARRILRLRNAAAAPDPQTVETVLSLEADNPSSLAVTDSDRFVYVAHAGGITRVDLQSRTARELTTPTAVPLAGFERLRWHRSSLVGVQVQPDGSRGLVVLKLDKGGNVVTSGTLIDPSLDREARSTLLTIVGDDVFYSVLDGAAPGADKPSVEVIVKRVTLP